MTLVFALATLMGTAGTAAEKRPIVNKCVDGRQTEDPSSPPCVAFFDGDNGGGTWQGVTADEITLLIYQTSVITVDAQGRTESTPPAGTYCDVDLMDCDGDGWTDPDPHAYLRIANAYSRYFNQRFETYNRHVRAFMYFASGRATPSSRRADAADNWERLKPFAVMDQTQFGDHRSVYADAMARRQTMVFGDYSDLGRAFFQQHSPKVWSYWPDVETSANLYSEYVCAKVAPTKVATGEFAGKDRKYALYFADDPLRPEARLRADLVRAAVSICGIAIGVEDVFTFPYSGYSIDTQGDRSYAAANAALMKTRGYNTILWAGGSESDTSKWADLMQYRPEWIVAGDGEIDGNGFGSSQGQASWSNAWVVSHQPRRGPLSEEPSYQAYKEAEPSGSDGGLVYSFYSDWFLFFTAVQTAGPTLDPIHVEAGLRALAPKTSTSPYAPGGHFPAGNFTFVKDGNESWWDPTGIVGSTAGCYRLVGGGKRFTAETWASAVEAGIGKRTEDGSPDGAERVPYRDPCTENGASGDIRAGIPFLEE